jgi:hypothetical protein
MPIDPIQGDLFLRTSNLEYLLIYEPVVEIFAVGTAALCRTAEALDVAAVVDGRAAFAAAASAAPGSAAAASSVPTGSFGALSLL